MFPSDFKQCFVRSILEVPSGSSCSSCVTFLHSILFCVVSVTHCLCDSYYLAISVMEHNASSPRDVCNMGALLQASASSQLWRQPRTYLWHNTNRWISITRQLWSGSTLRILYTECIKWTFSGEIMCVHLFYPWKYFTDFYIILRWWPKLYIVRQILF